MDDEVTSIYDNPYTLMGRESGKDMTEFKHLTQSIIDILTTPIGTRIDDPRYGSDLFSLFDKPFNQSWLAKARYYTTIALTRWEPRLSVLKTTFSLATGVPGRIKLDLYAIYLLGGTRLKFSDIELDFKKTYFTK